MRTRDKVVFTLNGTLMEVGGDETGMMLADYLRRIRRLTGTKIVCAEGDCGACSVLKRDSRSRSTRFLAINSCIAPVAQMDGSELVTVDALSEAERLTPVQEAMVKCHGSQCGFCTPGFVIALTGLVEKKLCEKTASSKLDEQEAKNALTGNLCRCTGYQPIIDAATSIEPARCTSVATRFSSSKLRSNLQAAAKKPLLIKTEHFQFYAPTRLGDAVRYLSKNPHARIVSAATDLGVVHNKGKIELSHVLSLHLISELATLKKTKGGRFQVGARVTLSELRRALKKDAPEFARFLDLFASPQIKNVATLIGNIGTASPIGDTPPFLLVSGARVHLRGPKKKRIVALSEFYKGYRKTAMKAGELIESIDFELPSKNDTVALYKISQRKDLDISAVNAAFRVRWADAKRSRITDAKIALGGVAATPLLLKKASTLLAHFKTNDDGLSAIVNALHAETSPMSDLRGTSAFRRVLVENLFKRFVREHLQ